MHSSQLTLDTVGMDLMSDGTTIGDCAWCSPVFAAYNSSTLFVSVSTRSTLHYLKCGFWGFVMAVQCWPEWVCVRDALAAHSVAVEVGVRGICDSCSAGGEGRMSDA